MPPRLFLDTEFTDLSPDAALISAAFVADPGDEFYAELADFEERACSEFVRTTVLPLLGSSRLTTTAFVQTLMAWLGRFGPDLRLIADSVWDRRLLAQTFAQVGQALPATWQFEVAPGSFEEGWRRSVFDDELAAYFLRHPTDKPHHALADARALRGAYRRAERSP